MFRLFRSGSLEKSIVFPSRIFGAMEESVPKGRISARFIYNFDNSISRNFSIIQFIEIIDLRTALLL